MVPTTTQQPATQQNVVGKTSPVAAKTPQTMAQPGAVVAAGTETPKKSIFKRWWFWLIVVLILGGLGVGGWLLFK